jgi:hypothetical protein
VTAKTATPLRDHVADVIRDNGYTRRLIIRTASIAHGTVRVTITPAEDGWEFSETAQGALWMIITGAFAVDGIQPKVTVLSRDKIVFQWYR